MEIFGRNSVEAALKNNVKIKYVYLDATKHKDLYKEFQNRKIQIKSILDYRGENLHNQKIVAIVDEFPYLTLDELIDRSYQKHKVPNLVILDKITDPQNVGAIIRNARAFNIAGLILPKFNQSPVNGTVIKASAGNAIGFDIALTSSLNNVVEKLKQKGYWIVDTAMDGKTTLEELKKQNVPLAIILGSEGDGTSQSLSKKADYHLSIKMNQQVESLNVSSAAAIIFHALFK